MNILVTGAAGYIGSVLVADLLSKGHNVFALDNFMYKQSSLAHLIRDKKLELVLGDVRDESIIKKYLFKSDIVIPLAAIVGAPACEKDIVLAKSINKSSVTMLLRNLSNNQRIIMPTTNSAYGSGNAINLCDETSPLRPISTYAKDKVSVEKELMEFANSTSLRLATVFGVSPRMRLDLLVNHFVYKALTDGYVVVFEGNFKRNYIHIMDVVQAFNLVIENESKFVGEIFNVGLSSANISKIELCSEIKKVIPKFVYFESHMGTDPDQRNYIVSNAKIEALGFKPQFTLQQGITELVKGIGMFNFRPFTNT
jgi:nucleoside-diphosphate-sugar epimerase